MVSTVPWADLEVLDAEGREVPIRSLWTEAVTVIGFVRHFG